MKNKIVISSLLLISLLLTYCGKEIKNENLTENDAIPVKIEEVKYQPFQQYVTFYSKLSGTKEATKGAMIGGKIEKINYPVGAYVKEKDVVVEFDTYNPAAQYEQAKAAYENLKKNYERMKALLQAGETSQANFDAIEAQYLVAKRNYESVRQMLFIEAPFDGTIVDIKVHPGDNVKGEAALFTISQTYKMRSKVWVSEKELYQFKKGMKVITEFNGETFVGRIVEISMAIDPMKQAFFVEVEFDNPKGILKSGLTAEIKILTYENPKAIIIPRNLVNKDEKGLYVFVVKNDKAEKRYITNGRESGLYYEVTSGLNEGDKLVVKGSAQLDDGTNVKIIQ
ncbi:MAG: efflux RND transporter periplasmic adaptor subunit [Ignavibacterium sp.]|nr:efflux RND transporter periplasmic adaptor subunit [Ignavibacterium sp.]MCX7610050.1 efflux RND transporter periplasmic adaptor subunit [Ignavibacterium sp.]MDW8375866.1 efflux RND transporter periplasmic adaptor subunit [Ignavibacteriales bacterium]